ncbi:MAG: hypothetical protein IPJ04_09685 [Candidatus Eisenbacteria bacterium]|nr:hypothetical protein [Candidatus Eisenbacteria bacterium]
MSVSGAIAPGTGAGTGAASSAANRTVTSTHATRAPPACASAASTNASDSDGSVLRQEFHSGRKIASGAVARAQTSAATSIARTPPGGSGSRGAASSAAPATV